MSIAGQKRQLAPAESYSNVDQCTLVYVFRKRDNDTWDIISNRFECTALTVYTNIDAMEARARAYNARYAAQAGSASKSVDIAAATNARTFECVRYNQNVLRAAVFARQKADLARQKAEIVHARAAFGEETPECCVCGDYDYENTVAEIDALSHDVRGDAVRRLPCGHMLCPSCFCRIIRIPVNYPMDELYDRDEIVTQCPMCRKDQLYEVHPCTLEHVPPESVRDMRVLRDCMSYTELSVDGDRGITLYHATASRIVPLAPPPDSVDVDVDVSSDLEPEPDSELDREFVPGTDSDSELEMLDL
ncbi:MAG: hypothetical protein DRR15_17600 [Gammaproteobacteria bacterium]|nr:MAG: hypothetical protein DRR15_17600 [Gammaproteobacteria bacterium]